MQIKCRRIWTFDGEKTKASTETTADRCHVGAKQKKLHLIKYGEEFSGANMFFSPTGDAREE